MRLGWLIGALAALSFSMTAVAKTPEELVREGMSGAGYGAALEALSGFAGAASDQPKFDTALGMTRFARGVERFAQAMYRHGLRPGGRTGMPMMLGIALPEGNPNPQPLSYAQFRTILSDLSADMSAVDEALKKVGEGAVKIPIDIHTMRIDIDGDGQAEKAEELFNLLRATAFMDLPENMPFVVAFDTADVHWLRGYANLVGAIADFWLAHDFEMNFNSAFSAFFPANAPSDEARRLEGGAGNIGGMDGRDIADFIAFIHLINWKVVEPARLAAVRERFLTVAATNRLTWKLARAETDDDREWLPNPRQKSVALPMFAVSDERIDAWLMAVGEIEEVLEGKKLMPHWRFSPSDISLAFEEPNLNEAKAPFKGAGVNLKRYFAEAKSFDLILWITGQAAAPFVEDGEVARFTAWRQAERIFGGDLLAYAFWFN
jgi:hypothetical protein